MRLILWTSFSCFRINFSRSWKLNVLCDPNRKELFSKMKTGSEVSEIRLPIDHNSIAAFSVITQKIVNITDAYDEAELSAIDPQLRFNRSWDRRGNFRSRQILTRPIIYQGNCLYGALEFINCSNGKAAFTGQDENILNEITDGLAMTLHRLSSKNVTENLIADIFQRYGVNYEQGIEAAIIQMILENRAMKRKTDSGKREFVREGSLRTKWIVVI